MARKKKTPKQVEAEIRDLTQKWKRALADYANLEKRIKLEKDSFVKFSNAALLDKLLSVLDDLERAEEHLGDKGLALAMVQFRSVLKSEGVEELKAKGMKFDPETMDCLEMAKGPKNIVVEVIQKGYSLDNKVLRPAKVKVGKGAR